MQFSLSLFHLPRETSQQKQFFLEYLMKMFRKILSILWKFISLNSFYVFSLSSNHFWNFFFSRQTKLSPVQPITQDYRALVRSIIRFLLNRSPTKPNYIMPGPRFSRLGVEWTNRPAQEKKISQISPVAASRVFAFKVFWRRRLCGRR